MVAKLSLLLLVFRYVHGSTNIALTEHELLASYLSSYEYRSEALAMRLPPDSFEVLQLGVSGKSNHYAVSTALFGSPKSYRYGDLDLNNPGYQTNLADYILTKDVRDRVAFIINLFDTKRPRAASDIPDWMRSTGMELNLALYDLHTKLRLQSFCNQLQSVVIRKLIEQMHYRLTLEVAGEYVSTDLQQITSLFYPHLDILLSDLEHHIKPQKTHGSSIWSMNSRTWQLKHFKSVATAELAAIDSSILTETVRARKTRIQIVS